MVKGEAGRGAKREEMEEEIWPGPEGAARVKPGEIAGEHTGEHTGEGEVQGHCCSSHDSDNSGNKRTFSYLVVGLVCLLLVFAVVQNFQIGSFKDRFAGLGPGTAESAAGAASAGTATGGAVASRNTAGEAPRRAAAVPAMVGGC